MAVAFLKLTGKKRLASTLKTGWAMFKMFNKPENRVHLMFSTDNAKASKRNHSFDFIRLLIVASGSSGQTNKPYIHDTANMICVCV